MKAAFERERGTGLFKRAALAEIACEIPQRDAPKCPKLARTRGLVGRAPRKRGGKPSKTGTSPDDYDKILIDRDRSGATSDHILYDLTAPTTAEVLKPLVARRFCILVS